MIFTFIATTLLTNNIKTSKVLVDTSDIITDEAKLFKSYRTALWMEGENDLELTRTAPPGTFLQKLYLQKNTDPITILKRYNAEDSSSLLERGFWFIGSLSGQILISVVSSFYPKVQFFFNPKPFFVIFNVFIRRKGRTKELRHIDL